MARKTGTIVPITGTIVHQRAQKRASKKSYITAIARALRTELGGSRRAIKTVMNWTGVSERTAKHWLAGTRGPSGEQLTALCRRSDSVTTAFFRLCGRRQKLAKDDLSEVRTHLVMMLEMLDAME